MKRTALIFGGAAYAFADAVLVFAIAIGVARIGQTMSVRGESAVAPETPGYVGRWTATPGQAVILVATMRADRHCWVHIALGLDRTHHTVRALAPHIGCAR